MEINGKKVLTLPQQVLQNQKDIADLKEEMDDIKKKYQHRIILWESSTYTCLVIFDIVNETSEAYTSLSQIYEEMGNKTFPAVSGFIIDSSETSFIYEISRGSTENTFDIDSMIPSLDVPGNQDVSLTLRRDVVTKL